MTHTWKQNPEHANGQTDLLLDTSPLVRQTWPRMMTGNSTGLLSGPPTDCASYCFFSGDTTWFEIKIKTSVRQTFQNPNNPSSTHPGPPADYFWYAQPHLLVYFLRRWNFNLLIARNKKKNTKIDSYSPCGHPILKEEKEKARITRKQVKKVRALCACWEINSRRPVTAQGRGFPSEFEPIILVYKSGLKAWKWNGR